MNDTTKVPAHEYILLYGSALEKAYRGLEKAEQVAKDMGDEEWLHNLTAVRTALNISAKGHLRELNRNSNLESPHKITPESYAAARAKSRTKTIADITRRHEPKISRNALAKWLKAHPQK